MRWIIQIASFLYLLLFSVSLVAQPDFSQKIEVEGVSCFVDIKNSDIAYYLPGKLSVVTDSDGKPDFDLLRTGYIGTAAYGDQYTSRLNSIVRFRVRMERLPASELEKVEALLWPDGGNVRLLPLPVSDIETNLVFTAIGDSIETTGFTDGKLSAGDKDGLNKKGTYWKEREFTLRLDEKSAEVLWDVLSKGQSMMSLSYAFFSEGKTDMDNEAITQGGKEILGKLKEQLSDNGDSVKINQVCVFADAFSIRMDVEKWPELLTKVDINQEVPPAYAALEIRCYDFYNELRPDLVAKRVEVKAKGVGRGDVIVKSVFGPQNPDIYVYNIRFPYAVMLDQPLYYRVTGIGKETAPVKTEWIEKTEWAGIIDISSSEDEIVEPGFEE